MKVEDERKAVKIMSFFALLKLKQTIYYTRQPKRRTTHTTNDASIYIYISFKHNHPRRRRRSKILLVVIHYSWAC